MRARPDMPGEKASLSIFSIIGRIFHFAMAREVIERSAGEGCTRDFFNDMVEHITEFSMRGMGREDEPEDEP